MTGIDYYPAIKQKKRNEAKAVQIITIGFVLSVIVFILDVTDILF